MNNPTYVIFTGPMWAAKTSHMLLALEKLKHQGKRIVVFKAAIDDRYSKDDIVTHSGWSVPAINVKTGSDIIREINALDEPPDVVAVDEAFMVDGVHDVLIWLFRHGVSIIVSTLDLSASGKPFAEVQHMLPWATHVEKCSAACTVCGADAHYTHKKVVDIDKGEEIQVGGTELYEARCWRHAPFMHKD